MAALPDDRSLGVKTERVIADNGAAYRSRRFAGGYDAWRSRTFAPNLIRRAPLAGLNGSSRCCCAIGPMLIVTPHQRIALMRSRLRCFVTTFIGLTRRSATGFPLRGSALQGTMCWQITVRCPDACRRPTGQARRRCIVCVHTYAIRRRRGARLQAEVSLGGLTELRPGIVNGGQAKSSSRGRASAVATPAKLSVEPKTALQEAPG